MTTQELIDTVCPKVRDLGWAYYFDAETVAVGEALGLDVFHFYVLGRGGVLGDVEPEVVASAFGYFNPTMVELLWNEGRAILAPREAARVYWSCAADLGRARFSELPGLDAYCEAAGAVNDAADSVALPLFAGFHAEGLVEDLPGRAMQLTAILREFRGSAHLLAVRASGLDARTAHFVKRPGDAAMFGWSEDDPPAIGPDEIEAMDGAEQLTDELVAPAYGVLDETGRQALVEGIDRIEAALVP